MATTFAYKVKDKDGQIHSGEMEGSSQTAVSKALRDRGYQPITVDEKSESALQKEIRIPGLTDRVKLKEVAVFSRQFATMINAGLSLLPARLEHSRRPDAQQGVCPHHLFGEERC
jgi:type IV pilus assembly protein PilC